MNFYAVMSDIDIKEYEFSVEDMDNDPELIKTDYGYVPKNKNYSTFYFNKNDAIKVCVDKLTNEYLNKIQKLYRGMI